MQKNNSAYTLVELLVVMGIFSFIIAISGVAFKNILIGANKESKSIESQIADIVGLELLRVDVEHAGYGLPWSYQTAITYSEAASDAGFPVSGKNPADFNVPLATASTTEAPKLIAGSNNGYFNGSDYLVIRSTVVARNTTAPKWSYVITDGTPKVSSEPSENLVPGDRILVLRPVFKPSYGKELVMQSNTVFYAYSTVATSSHHIRKFYPSEPYDKRLFYGLVPSDTTPRMPFNRADYYIRDPGTASMSERCARNTGILYKGIINNTTGTDPGEITEIPLMDCVADLQIVFGLDSNADSRIDNYAEANAFDAYTAAQIRENLKEVLIYILSHEGKADRNYTYPNETIRVGDGTTGREFNIKDTIGDDAATGISWKNYRWKLYKLVTKPKNM